MSALKLYKLASTLSLPLLVGGFYLRSLSQKAYRERLGERFGWSNGACQPGGVVIHGASVGEIIALQPFIEHVLAAHPTLPVTVTSFTPTGSAQILQRFAKRVQHCYLPMDNPISCGAFLKRVQPQLVVLMETEIWPTLIDQCQQYGIKLLLINGRISKRSFPRYEKIRSLVAASLEKFDRILTQSQDDAERFITLGAPNNIVSTSGNIKYDLSPPQNIAAHAQSMMANLAGRPIWVVGSSHEDEEALIIDTLKIVRQQMPNIVLILAPRHPERHGAIEKQLQAENIGLARRSTGKTPSANDSVWLIDTMGELLLFYCLADVCTIAGSFGATGGHNPLEAALFKKAIVVGSNMANFQDINQQLLAANGVVQLAENSAATLSTRLLSLLKNKPDACSLGDNAFGVLARNQGALAKSVAAFSDLLR